ncbi:MAG: PAS domain S-box protein [Acidimicrobiia bacterium]|nr:PAS domain S-box protein [Acidimicrobiia bacterium]
MRCRTQRRLWPSHRRGPRVCSSLPQPPVELTVPSGFAACAARSHIADGPENARSPASCREEAGTFTAVVDAHTNDLQSNDGFRLLVESVRDYAIFMLDTTGHVVTWNLGAERIKGYQASEIIGKHFSTFYLPDDAATGICEAELIEAERLGRIEAEGWRVRKDGSKFWAAVVITALRDQDGTLRGFAKVTRDVTEQQKVTQALLEHERLLAETQRLARLGSWEWDIAADRMTWSEELFRIFGLDPLEFVPTYEAYLARLGAEDRIIADELVRKAVERGDPYAFEHQVRLPDGGVRWVQARGRVIRDETGRVAKLQGTAQDVTDQREALDARAQLETLALRQRHALEVNDDIIQGLAVADLALNLEAYDKAREAVATTLAAARQFVTDLLGDAAGDISPGDLRRRSAENG